MLPIKTDDVGSQIRLVGEMEKELQQFADVIEQLKPSVGRPEFNQVLIQLTRELPSEKRFLIKMELKRLAKPCLRAIDLRGQVDGDCRLFEFRDRKHYLDDVAIDVFKRQVKVYGNYTFGVYEAVMKTENNFRVMRDRAEAARSEEKSPPESNQENLPNHIIPVVNLLAYHHRNHERMNFAVALDIEDEHHNFFKGTSVDISIEGLRLKLPNEYAFNAGQPLQIHFRGFEDEFAMDNRNGIHYHVITTKFERGNFYLILKRNTDFPAPSFDKFLNNFIHGNKRRYKVNLNNTVEAIINKTAEQYISPCSPSLPIFIDEQDNHLLPRYAMLNSTNKEILDYWKDENDDVKLGYMLKPSRLAWLQKQSTTRAEMYIYCFTHVKDGAVYFYSASNLELEQNDKLKALYIGFGSRKVSWRVFKLTLSSMTPDEAYAPLSIPDSAANAAKKQNSPPSARLMARLKNLKYIVHITDVTSLSGQRQYASRRFDRKNLGHLRVFGHPRNKAPIAIKPYRYRFSEQRMETRYILRSPIELTGFDGSFHSTGISEDISISGLRLEISPEFAGDTGSMVKIQFPRLTSKSATISMNYEVIHHNADRNILHLKAVEGEAGAAARQFFNTLIKQNKQSLKTYPEEEETPGIGHALRCINARHTPNFAFLLAKTGVRYEPDTAVYQNKGTVPCHLLSHAASQNRVNIEFLYRDRQQESPLITSSIKTLKIDHQLVREELLVAYEPTAKEIGQAVIPKLDKQFANDESKKTFISEAISKGHFVAFQVLITLTGKPDLAMLQAELNYVSTYALHRAKELEEKIWSIGASVHLIDMTQEVLMRFGYDQATIARNSQVVKANEATNRIQKMLN